MHLAGLIGGRDVGEGPSGFKLQLLVIMEAQKLDQRWHHVGRQHVEDRRARLNAQHPAVVH